MVETYLKIRQELAGVVLIVDSRRPPTKSDMDMAGYLLHHEIPFVVAATKSDKLNRSQIIVQKRSIEDILGKNAPVVVFSAQTGQGKNELWKEIKNLIEKAGEAIMVT
jgi:GTP-binding protein